MRGAWGLPSQIDTTLGGLIGYCGIGYCGIGKKALARRRAWLLPHRLRP